MTAAATIVAERRERREWVQDQMRQRLAAIEALRISAAAIHEKAMEANMRGDHQRASRLFNQSSTHKRQRLSISKSLQELQNELTAMNDVRREMKAEVRSTLGHCFIHAASKFLDGETFDRIMADAKEHLRQSP